MKKYILILFLFTNLSCFFNPVGPAESELYKEFDLKYGRKAVIGDENLFITFLDVIEDSRCPVGYRCFWEGNGAVLLKIEKKNYPKMVDTVNTALDPQDLLYLNYKVSLLNLKPYPVADSIIRKHEYVITLYVDKIPIR